MKHRSPKSRVAPTGLEPVAYGLGSRTKPDSGAASRGNSRPEQVEVAHPVHNGATTATGLCPVRTCKLAPEYGDHEGLCRTHRDALNKVKRVCWDHEECEYVPWPEWFSMWCGEQEAAQ